MRRVVRCTGMPGDCIYAEGDRSPVAPQRCSLVIPLPTVESLRSPQCRKRLCVPQSPSWQSDKQNMLLPILRTLSTISATHNSLPNVSVGTWINGSGEVLWQACALIIGVKGWVYSRITRAFFFSCLTKIENHHRVSFSGGNFEQWMSTLAVISVTQEIWHDLCVTKSGKRCSAFEGL